MPEEPHEYYREMGFWGVGKGFAWYGYAPLWVWLDVKEKLALDGGESALDIAYRGCSIDDKGRCTRNSMSAWLVRYGDQAVPLMERAVVSGDDELQEIAFRILAEINSSASRGVLMNVFQNGSENAKVRAGLALTQHPQPDAEQVFMSLLGEKPDVACHAATALGDIRSTRAVTLLEKIQANPKGWRLYYECVLALRKIRGQELDAELQRAIELVLTAKFSDTEDAGELASAANVIEANMATALPDLIDICFRTAKGNASCKVPHCRTLLQAARNSAIPLVEIALVDPDPNIRFRILEVLKDLHWAADYRKQLQLMTENDSEDLIRNSARELLDEAEKHPVTQRGAVP